MITVAKDKDVALNPYVWDWCKHCQNKAIAQYFGMLSAEERQLKYGEQHHVLPWREPDQQWLKSVGIPSALFYLKDKHPWLADLLITDTRPIKIIRTRKSIEFGLPFTLCAHTIFSSTRPSVRTLVHELVHIGQRRNPAMMEHVYVSMGWTVIPKAPRSTLLHPSQMLLHNPDATGFPTFALQLPEHGQQLWTSVLMYNFSTQSITDDIVKVRGFTPQLQERRRRQSSSSSTVQQRSSHPSPAWQAVLRVREETQDLHPNEVMAYDIAAGVARY